MVEVACIGASFDTGNLGVSALGWSSMHVIRSTWPGAGVTILGAGRTPGTATVGMNGSATVVPTWPVRYCKNVTAANHLLRLGAGVVLARLFASLRRRWAANESTLGALCRASAVMDITGGDSFSDIYGVLRFLRGYLLKRVCQMTGLPFILLPQTYGPFNRGVTRVLARRILSHSTLVFARDQESFDLAVELLGSDAKVRLCPDVAFTLEARRPANEIVCEAVENLRTTASELIGLNVSGLLYNGGYTGRNEFGLKVDYKSLVARVVEYFVSECGAVVLLVPHVIPDNWPQEDDLIACRNLRESLPEVVREQVAVLEGSPDPCETKWAIGQCDFFLGSRMHATIASLSQCVPAIGLAYSRKFDGVYSSIGVSDCVLDLRSMMEDEVLTAIQGLYAVRNSTRERLQKTIPKAADAVYSMLRDLDV